MNNMKTMKMSSRVDVEQDIKLWIVKKFYFED